MDNDVKNVKNSDENIIEYIYFGTLDNPTSTQGRSGKMFLR